MPKNPTAQLSPFERQVGKRISSHHKRREPGPHQRQGDRVSSDDVDKPRKFLTGRDVCERYSITDMALWRWIKDPDLNFPGPTMVVRGRRFWDEKNLRRWERSRIPPRDEYVA